MPRWLSVVSIVAAAGCGADPGRDVQPMSPPLQSPAPAAASDSTIIPLDQVRKSQAAAVSQRLANTEITVTYSRPVARKRELYGALIPYGVVWNPGADQATAIQFSRDVTVGDQPLAAGKYSLWASPGPETWTVIFSRAADVYHTPYPGEAQDALRLDVTIEAVSHAEVLTFAFPLVDGKTATLALDWGMVRVPLRIVVP
jgi:hypothetical protein